MALRLSALFILFYALRSVSGACHTCQSNFVVCHDETRFSMCVDGISKSDVIACPGGYVCTGEVDICVETSAPNSVEATCEAGCDRCTSPEKLFACLDATTYAYCFGEDVPITSATGVCPDGYVCNLNSVEVCTAAAEAYPSCYKGVSEAATTLAPSTDVTPGPAESSTVSPTTAAMTPTTAATSERTTAGADSTPAAVTTPPAVQSSSTAQSTSTRDPLDDTAFCQEKQRGGFFKVENDPTCQKFVYCYLLSGEYLGIRYTCYKYEYFNSQTGKCGKEKPANC